VTLDQLAQRYSLLPSECLHRATTFDLEVLDIARSYERMKENKAHGITPEVSEEVMLQALGKMK